MQRRCRIFSRFAFSMRLKWMVKKTPLNKSLQSVLYKEHLMIQERGLSGCGGDDGDLERLAFINDLSSTSNRTVSLSSKRIFILEDDVPVVLSLVDTIFET